MPYPKDAAKLRVWEEFLTISLAKHPTLWAAYDDQIQRVVPIFNAFLAGKSLYTPLDWKFIKAMAWVETGAENAAWKNRPMQIGNHHDEGLHYLLTKPQGKLIMPPQFLIGLTEYEAANQGPLNIIVGIGYLLCRLANFKVVFDPVPIHDQRHVVPLDGSGQTGIIGVPDPTKSSSVTDSLTRAAIPLQRPTPGAGIQYRFGQQPNKTPKAHLGIISWKSLTPEFASKDYNGGGDGNYADKFMFAYNIVKGS